MRKTAWRKPGRFALHAPRRNRTYNLQAKAKPPPAGKYNRAKALPTGVGGVHSPHFETPTNIEVYTP
jgi:hypothetical protein